jgi:DNA-binding transcriptional LysR family regulator
MELRHFRAFVVLAEERHFGRSAEILGISAATLTEQIQALEQSVGTRLVNRTSRSVSLTVAGKSFLVEAEATLRHAQDARLAARNAARGISGKLEIGYILLAAVIGLVPSVIGQFRRENRSIDINLHRIEVVAQQRAIVAGQLDLGIIRTPAGYPSGIDGFTAVQLPYAAILPADHRLAQRTEIKPSELADESFVSLDVESEVAFWRNIRMFALRSEPRITKRAPDILSLLNLVAAGYGVSIAAIQLARLNIPGVVFVPLKTRERNRVEVIYRSDDQTPALQALKTFIKTRTDLLTL